MGSVVTSSRHTYTLSNSLELRLDESPHFQMTFKTFDIPNFLRAYFRPETLVFGIIRLRGFRLTFLQILPSPQADVQQEFSRWGRLVDSILTEETATVNNEQIIYQSKRLTFEVYFDEGLEQTLNTFASYENETYDLIGITRMPNSDRGLLTLRGRGNAPSA